MALNPYILVPAATFAVAQVAKFALAAFRGKLDFRLLYSSGGMPSVHSAIVTSLATTALLVDGAGSHLFGFSLVLAVIVMYDSFGVRRAAGEQARAINSLLDGLELAKVRVELPMGRVREIMGHQPEEVMVGAVVGVVLGCLFNYTRLGVVGSFLEGSAKNVEMIIYAAIGLALILGTILMRIVLKRRKSPTLSHLAKQVLAWGQSIGWLTLLAVVLDYEHASYLAWRLWLAIIFVIGIVWGSSLISHWRPRLRTSLNAERTAARKQKWFTWSKRKRSAKA